ncbi:MULTISPECIES: DNA starvation/stationary phase protection protein [unclassified Breznakia]|uniref:Dps family protein n=1 Tax=unclassified Breznakia TaxID=2623764 RepID=UPI0024756278|nr:MULTISPECIES: DNA starvation/stationary phase protection protein [unclassified Breznakia]MDH6366516.1 starvation-inducible DNA-binding protein [Breznakia sp. PH1-1]MDH6403609.1 starvation-inducible DNA-binding protein [Breznakia sp. PF1-11]MDH6411318.1 starvation-inducible DNA-binding protein [Breznakia sp. PFB1-11]MDH6413706.1 starvation-inducible DNA-binding protein [Breznakia sp. PFB1-14]MDH6415863.1 starvation-inducible DNA-binding protein [Breznakia sp. PFB1-4]
METKLNKLLADLVVEYHKLQNFHWYVKGSDFFTAHVKLEEYYDFINEAIDEVGELILMVNEKPLASLKDYLAITAIEEANMDHKDSKSIWKEVLKDFEFILSEVREVKESAEDKGIDVVGIQMDDYIKEFTKSIWMIKQVV